MKTIWPSALVLAAVPAHAQRELTDADDGRVIRVSVGDELIIRLPRARDDDHR